MNDELKLGDNWHEYRNSIAFVWSKNDISLEVSNRFDGNGNSVTRFIVTDGKKETTYEKYDSAAEAYQMLKQKYA